MRNKYLLFFIIVSVAVANLFFAWQTWAGSPNSPGLPNATNSFTLEDIYQRLNAGTTGSQSTFTEPSIAPGIGTMHTLNEIMAKAPALNNTNGATTSNVLTGKTFWGLTSGQWGIQTGSAPVGSNVLGGNGQLSFTIPDGFYSGSKTCIGSDSNLVAGNVKSGINIFGVQGSYLCQAGLTDCGGVCTNLNTDNNHCGGCGNVCPAGTRCSAGACLLSCQAGLTDCGGVCTNLNTDNNHCGGCGNICPTGTGCHNGICF